MRSIHKIFLVFRLSEYARQMKGYHDSRGRCPACCRCRSHSNDKVPSCEEVQSRGWTDTLDPVCHTSTVKNNTMDRWNVPQCHCLSFSWQLERRSKVICHIVKVAVNSFAATANFITEIYTAYSSLHECYTNFIRPILLVSGRVGVG